MSLKSRRKLLLHNVQGSGSDEPEMISVLTVDTSVVPFPYKEGYGLVLNNQIRSSGSPIYIFKKTPSNWYVITAKPRTFGKTFTSLTVDTSELGDVPYEIANYGDAPNTFGACNYPVQEVKYSDDGTKLYIVRE